MSYEIDNSDRKHIMSHALSMIESTSTLAVLKWGEGHDDAHTPLEWGEIVMDQLFLALEAASEASDTPLGRRKWLEYRDGLYKTAGVFVNAIAAFERKRKVEFMESAE